MGDLRTAVTELVTGLGMLGYDDVESAIAARPAAMVSVSPEQWAQLSQAHAGGALHTEFDSAFENGRAFLLATDGLRSRLPSVIEWKGAQRNPGDEVLPVDLRIDYVYLISCKYLSKIVHNASPVRVFDHSLRPAQAMRACDWYAEVAPDEYQHLYELTLASVGAVGFPAKATELIKPERSELRSLYPSKWSTEIESAYTALCSTVASASASRWQASIRGKAEQEATFWRLLRFGSAPYFVLGTAKADSLRLRIATPWDWRQQYSFGRFAIKPKPGGQPMVAWHATVKNRHSGEVTEVDGHVEIRWSHGRFGGWPEAKVYLDSPHRLIPGYFALT